MKGKLSERDERIESVLDPLHPDPIALTKG